MLIIFSKEEDNLKMMFDSVIFTLIKGNSGENHQDY